MRSLLTAIAEGRDLEAALGGRWMEHANWEDLKAFLKLVGEAALAEPVDPAPAHVAAAPAPAPAPFPGASAELGRLDGLGDVGDLPDLDDLSDLGDLGDLADLGDLLHVGVEPWHPAHLPDIGGASGELDFSDHTAFESIMAEAHPA